MHTEHDFSLSGYRFALPDAQIAQFPPEERGCSRLLVMPRKPVLPPAPELKHAAFHELGEHLPQNALLVVNNARVLQARLLGTRPSGGKVEFLLLTPLPLATAAAAPCRDGWFEAEVHGLARAGGRVREGDIFTFGENLRVAVLESGPFGQRRALLAWRGDPTEAFAAAGHMPLPPYIKRADGNEDRLRYQTIFARSDKTGAVAAPTAGLHFTEAQREALNRRGFQWAELTLYVGYGTFSPVRDDDIRRHRMHREYFEIPEKTAEAVTRAKAEGRPVIAVGTTTVRALEGVAEICGRVQPFTGWTDIFLYPSRVFRVADGIVTNFHLPESSLLMMVAAFAGRRRVLDAYAEAVRRGYRFFSYGDAMLLH